MTGFSTDWLALREPFDQAARAAPIDPAFFAALKARVLDGGALAIVDLGCGTGANLREIAPRLGGRQHWRLVDHDARVLAALPDALAPWAAARGLQLRVDAGQPPVIDGPDGLHVEVTPHQADLVGALSALPLAGAHLVTASALLDLVSAPWLDALLQRCQAEDSAVWWALNVDDRIDWSPGDAEDARIHALFRAHQQHDKGFGPALGGAATAHATQRLAHPDWRVQTVQTDWQIDAHRGAAEAAMLYAMIDGIGAAASEQAPDEAEAVAQWQQRKRAQIGGLQLRVGHSDVLGWSGPSRLRRRAAG
ncbi:MAG: class I SAM-dependent methyltransferase [Variovorax sp.]|nr:MAG: class I SAM-dependent methyltransferase [Variovorax sp.]